MADHSRIGCFTGFSGFLNYSAAVAYEDGAVGPPLPARLQPEAYAKLLFLLYDPA